MHCKASLSLSLVSNIDVRKLRTCPSCSEPWASIPGSSTVELQFSEFIDGFKRMTRLLNGEFGFPKLFSMSMEISEPEEEKKN